MEHDAQNNEIETLEKTLNQLEHELQAHYSDMGKSLLELAGHEQKEVNRLVDDIIAARRQLSAVRHEVECPACTALNTPDARYCKHCGQRLAPATEKGE